MNSNHRMIIVMPLSFSVVDIEFTEEGLEAATTASIQHIEGRGNKYVADWSPLDGPGTITFDAVYRSNQPNRETLRANRRSGIYLILDRDANRAYVGLTNNFNDRFFNGNPTHPRRCRQDCRCHGHITVTLETCTSHNIINTDSDSGFSVYILTPIPYRGNQIGQAEIEWYYILREHGYEMVNAVWMLGKKGYVGRPIISFNIKNPRYHYFPTISEAASTLLPNHSGGAGAVGRCVSGYQNQDSGYTHRYATPDEVREYTEGIDVGDMVNNFDSITTWRWGKNGPVVDLEDRCRGCSGEGKHTNRPRLTWEAGPLSSTEISHLEGTMKGRYKKPRPSRFSGVRWKSSANPPGWQYAANRPNANLFQTGPLVGWKKPVVLLGHIIKKNDVYAALTREEKILEEGWQNENNDQTHKSNAKLLNFYQPWRFINGKHFTDWRDGKIGLLVVLIFYGSILSLLTATVLQLFV
jgi:hypothetical protein